jgi:hypothetical protein
MNAWCQLPNAVYLDQLLMPYLHVRHAIHLEAQ